jgi:hypothetical protein
MLLQRAEEPMASHITHDPLYDTVDRDDFMAMIEVDRYADRSDAFDAIISATEDHFWDPTDAAYIDFDVAPFDLSEDTILPREMVVELNCAVADRLDEGQRIQLANENARFFLSSILHGEQGALSLSASLCHVLREPGSQEYAANQAREEARHVNAFARYIATRWGRPLRAGPTLASLMDEVVQAPEVYKKLVGMQMLIEGLAMGAFATLHARSSDPLLRRLVQLVMTDEAFHHKFGKIWAERTVPKLTSEEHERVEDWALQCFQTLLFNLVNSEQKQEIYGQFGLDWQWVRSAVMESFTDEDRRDNMRQQTNIFRVLVKTLLKAGIITERTRPMYATWVDMEELHGEQDEVAGQDVADAGIASLREINQSRERLGYARPRR